MYLVPKSIADCIGHDPGELQGVTSLPTEMTPTKQPTDRSTRFAMGALRVDSEVKMSKRRNGVPVQFSFQQFAECVGDLNWSAHQPADTHWQARLGKDVFNLWPTTGKFQCGVNSGRIRTIDDLEMRIPQNETGKVIQSHKSSKTTDERIADALERIAAALERSREPLFD